MAPDLTPPQSPLTLAHLLDPAVVAHHLAQGGLSREAVARLAGRFVRVAQRLQEEGIDPSSPAHAFFVPGRIEVLGKHTDYAGGRSLTCALERGFCLVAVPGHDAAVQVIALDRQETAAFALHTDLKPRARHWSAYPMTVARRVARNFPGALCGGQMAFSSDLPAAAGMSSSSALIVAVFMALSAINTLPAHPAYRQAITGCEALVEYLGCVENGQTFGALLGDQGVGTFGGSEDHTALCCSLPGLLRQYSYAPTRFEQAVPLPGGYGFALAVSGVTAQKTGAARARYNRAARLAADAAQAWRKATGRDDPHLAAALAGLPFSRALMLEALRAETGSAFAPEALVDRFEHFYTEHQRIIPQAVETLREGDLEAFGHLADQSQQAAERLLKNQVVETVFLARQARRLGAAAASSFGAGFGGSVWALVRDADAEGFLERWADSYADAFPGPAQRAAFFIDRPGPAAFALGAA